MSGSLDRRAFLKAAALGCGGLAVGWWLPRDTTAQEAGRFAPNAWVRVTADGVTVVVDRSEMGQGVMTSLPMLVAEELEVPLEEIQLESAPAAPEYFNPLLQLQGTGGSSSVRAAWKPLRQAGAAARMLLVAAAAQQWKVAPGTCRAEQGRVVHAASGRSLKYAALAKTAATLPVPKRVPLKKSRDFKVIGKAQRRLDTPSKVDGSAVFGMDFKVPGMLTASVARPPTLGGTVASFDAKPALAVAGVKKVVQIPSGVAVVADTYWNARKGRSALKVRWNPGPHAKLNSEAIRRDFAAAGKRPGNVAEEVGSVLDALGTSVKTVEAVYEVPYLAHATMEPQNCTAHVRAGRAELWGPFQMQTLGQAFVAKALGLKPSQVKINTTLLGGGFGRRLENDFAVEAAQISQKVAAPVKLVWSREEDMRHSVYRPATWNRLKAGLNAAGRPTVWTHKIVGQSIFKRVFPQFVKNGIDSSSVEGAVELPYAIPVRRVDYVMVDAPVGVAFWRSVGHSQNCFVVEGFIDELAHATGQDPYGFRDALMPKHPRHRHVLRLAANEADWAKPLPAGRGRGIAVSHSFGSYAAQVAEVSVSKSGEVRVHRVVVALDCGMVVNPDTVVAQMESAVVFGLTAALYGEITVEDGRVHQSNFHDYRMLRMHEMPQIDVHVVDSDEPHGGVGEPGVPPVAPAVVNAVFAATGKRIRRLPIRPEDLR